MKLNKIVEFVAYSLLNETEKWDVNRIFNVRLSFQNQNLEVKLVDNGFLSPFERKTKWYLSEICINNTYITLNKDESNYLSGIFSNIVEIKLKKYDKDLETERKNEKNKNLKLFYSIFDKKNKKNKKQNYETIQTERQ